MNEDYGDRIENLKKFIITKSAEIQGMFREGDNASAQKALDDVDNAKNQIEEAKQLQTAQLNSRIDELGATLKRFEQEPALRNSGYITVDGGTKDANNKSFPDFLLAIMRKDDRRLRHIYKSAKDMSEGSGTAGGYLVPTEYLTPLLEVENEMSPIIQRCTRIPVKGDHGTWPALDQYFTPTAGSGNTAFAGRITSTPKAEGAALAETQPQFVELEWTVHKEGGYVEVSNELIADSPMAIDVLLRRLFGVAIASKKERHIINGSGAGEPTGILNAACAVGTTPIGTGTFVYKDAILMKSHLKKVGGEPCWIIHPGLWNDIGVFEVSTGSGGVFQANLQSPLGQNLLGYPIFESEHMPQPDYNDAILADLKGYCLFEKEELAIAFSEHAAFTSDKGTWRFTSRFDGQPWLKNKITLADPVGSYYVSPFVYHNDA
jgi:HK97 family phage major capsid protein